MNLSTSAGDQDQWEFPEVELTKLEKRMILAWVMYTATVALFRKHTYTFGEKYLTSSLTEFSVQWQWSNTTSL